MNLLASIISEVGSSQPANRSWCNVPVQDSLVETIGLNRVLKINGVPVLIGGKTASGEWVDVVVFENWLKWAIQTQVFNLMRRVSKPSAIQIENAINVALEAGKQLGGITRYKVTATNIDPRNRTASFEWKAQLTNAIHSTTISGIVKP